nr:acyltransferase [Duganella qianjiadongensis]
MPAAPKLLFVESLRGLAACQVVLLHYCAAFLPVLARVPGQARFPAESWLSHSPFFLLLDGYSSVYLFFVMSGFVLAPSFQYSTMPAWRTALKRLIRLQLPVLAAFGLAVILSLALPSAKQHAFAYSRSPWLDFMNHNSMQIWPLLQDGLWNSLLAGYQNLSVFSPWPQLASLMHVAPLETALNSPMWTIHVEFWGSLMLIALVYLLRGLGGHRRWPVLLLFFCLAGSSQLSLFLAGYCLYQVWPWLQAIRPRLKNVAGLAMVLAGLMACGSKSIPLLSTVWNAIGQLGLYHADSDFHWQSQIGALAIFMGVLLCVPLQRWLSRPLLTGLGRLSFSVYLLHFPILITLGCAIFAALAGYSYAWACALSVLVGAGATFALAYCFERYVDRRAIALARRYAV